MAGNCRDDADDQAEGRSIERLIQATGNHLQPDRFRLADRTESADHAGDRPEKAQDGSDGGDQVEQGKGAIGFRLTELLFVLGGESEGDDALDYQDNHQHQQGEERPHDRSPPVHQCHHVVHQNFQVPPRRIFMPGMG